MMNFSRILIAALVFIALTPSVLCQNVIINEVQSSNQETIQDNSFDWDDWVELHNTSGSPVNVAGWFISNNLGVPAMW